MSEWVPMGDRLPVLAADREEMLCSCGRGRVVEQVAPRLPQAAILERIPHLELQNGGPDSGQRVGRGRARMLRLKVDSITPRNTKTAKDVPRLPSSSVQEPTRQADEAGAMPVDPRRTYNDDFPALDSTKRGATVATNKPGRRRERKTIIDMIKPGQTSPDIIDKILKEQSILRATREQQNRDRKALNTEGYQPVYMQYEVTLDDILAKEKTGVINVQTPQMSDKISDGSLNVSPHELSGELLDAGNGVDAKAEESTVETINVHQNASTENVNNKGVVEMLNKGLLLMNSTDICDGVGSETSKSAVEINEDIRSDNGSLEMCNKDPLIVENPGTSDVVGLMPDIHDEADSDNGNNSANNPVFKLMELSNEVNYVEFKGKSKVLSTVDVAQHDNVSQTYNVIGSALLVSLEERAIPVTVERLDKVNVSPGAKVDAYVYNTASQLDDFTVSKPGKSDILRPPSAPSPVPSSSSTSSSSSDTGVYRNSGKFAVLSNLGENDKVLVDAKVQKVSRPRGRRRGVGGACREGSPAVLGPGDWRVTGDLVVQVDGLPVDLDITPLQDMVANFGCVLDYQVQAQTAATSVRFRLNSKDACDYTVQCLNGTDTLFPDCGSTMTVYTVC